MLLCILQRIEQPLRTRNYPAPDVKVLMLRKPGLVHITYYCFIFFNIFSHSLACGILHGSNPHPLKWKFGTPTTGLPGKSPCHLLLKWENWDSEMWCAIPKVTQEFSCFSRVGILVQYSTGSISVIYGLSSTAATLVPARYHAMCWTLSISGPFFLVHTFKVGRTLPRRDSLCACKVTMRKAL